MRHISGKQPLTVEGQIEAGNQLIQGGGHRRDFGHRFAEHDGGEVVRRAALQLALQSGERAGDLAHRQHADIQRQANDQQARHQQAGNRFPYLMLFALMP